MFAASGGHEGERRDGPSERPAGRRAAALPLLLSLASLLHLALPATAASQAAGSEPGLSEAAGARWFPDTTAFAPLLAAPRETGLRGAFILADRPDLEPAGDPPAAPEEAADFRGTNVEAEVALGLRLPVALLREETADGPAVALEFETGVFTRFFMEAPEKDLINADFRVGVPLSLGYRGWEARLELRHMSSHFGDDFVKRFDPEFTQVSQEGFELLLARRLGAGFRLYGGGDWNFNLSSEEVVERSLARWGLEFDPGSVEGDRRVWPFAAIDFQISGLTDEVAGTAAGGVGLRVGTVGLRLETRGHFGPSPMGQLRRSDETFWGLGLRILPGGGF